jgi:hypothetical protein
MRHKSICLNLRVGCVALAFGLWLAGAATSSARAADDIVAFCRQHGTLDYPDRVYFGARYQPGMVPPQVKATDATNWRCRDGKVLVCMNSADGDSCSKKDPSLTPNQYIRDDCTENDNISRAASAYSASTWRCESKRPVVDRTYRLDGRGFMSLMWLPYVVRNGKPIKPHAADFADPR